MQRSVGALREGRRREEMLVGKSLNLGNGGKFLGTLRMMLKKLYIYICTYVYVYIQCMNEYMYIYI